MKTTLHRLIPLFVLCSMVHAATISYTDSGTFTAATPTTPFSGPSEAWSFSFQADTNPVVLDFGNGGFDFAFSNFRYSLNGSVDAITPTTIRFFTAANGGGFFICFGAQPCGNGVFPNGLGTGFGGPQLYSGPNSAPTLLPGSFILPFAVAVNSNSYDQGNTTLLAAIPEPATWLTLAVGLVVLGGRRRLHWRT